MLVRSIIVLLLAIAGYFAYMAYFVDQSYALYIVPFVLMLTVAYIFSPQISWWYYKRNPKEIELPAQKILHDNLQFYRTLSKEDKKKFNIRLSEFIRSKDWSAVELKGVPYDVQAIIGSAAIMLTFDKEQDYLFEDYENIILYKNGFHSPHYKKYRHSSEVNFNDKCLIFSLKHIITAFKEEGIYYNLPLHEFSKVYLEKYPDERPKYNEDTIWAQIENKSNYTKESIEQFVGLELDDIAPVLFNLKYHFGNK